MAKSGSETRGVTPKPGGTVKPAPPPSPPPKK